MTGEDVRAMRERCHLTQEGLARILKVSFVTVNRWERHDIEPISCVATFVNALNLASLADPEIVRRISDWSERGEFYFWARIFKLAHEYQTHGRRS